MNASSLILELRGSGLEGAVISAGDKGFHTARRVWNGIADRKPEAIVRARNISDIVATIGIARQRGALLAVRGGGHSLPGLSTCDGGVVLDMSLMNSITINSEKRTVEVFGGALLGDLDKAGVPHGLVVPAGVVSHTGVAGLTLGGGMGWLSRRYGLTIDSLVAIDLVTADGQAIHTNANEEPELFWGLRGGGGNFGVVTKFTFKMHPLGPVAVGRWEYPRGAVPVALRRLDALADAAPRDLTIGLNLMARGLAVTAFWCGGASVADQALAPLGQLAPGASGGHGPDNFIAHQSRHDELMRWGRRYYAKGGYFGNLTDGIIGEMIDAIAAAPTPDSDIYLIQLGGAVGDVAEDATAYTGRAAKYYWIASPIWDDAAEDKHCMAWGRAAASRLAALSMSGNYVNEQADFGRDVAYGAYGAEKYRRLQKLKARYDPGNLFRLNQNIEPLS